MAYKEEVKRLNTAITECRSAMQVLDLDVSSIEEEISKLQNKLNARRDKRTETNDKLSGLVKRLNDTVMVHKTLSVATDAGYDLFAEFVVKNLKESGKSEEVIRFLQDSDADISIDVVGSDYAGVFRRCITLAERYEFVSAVHKDCKILEMKQNSDSLLVVYCKLLAHIKGISEAPKLYTMLTKKTALGKSKYVWCLYDKGADGFVKQNKTGFNDLRLLVKVFEDDNYILYGRRTHNKDFTVEVFGHLPVDVFSGTVFTLRSRGGAS